MKKEMLPKPCKVHVLKIQSSALACWPPDFGPASRPSTATEGSLALKVDSIFFGAEEDKRIKGWS